MQKFLVTLMLVASVCFTFAENLQSKNYFINFTPTERAILKPDELKGFHFYSQSQKTTYKKHCSSASCRSRLRTSRSECNAEF